MSLHADLVGNEALSAPGTGTTITLGASATGFRSFLEAEGAGDVTNGQTLVPVTIASNFVDGIPTRRETATVTYNTGSPPTLTARTTIRSNNGSNTAIDAGADCVVYWELIASNVATVSDVAYDDDTWDGNTDVPTKNAVRDKFESLSVGVTNPMTANLDVGGFSIIGAAGSEGGHVIATGGAGTVTVGGNVVLTGGLGETTGGKVTATGGVGTTGDGGNVELTAGPGAADGGRVILRSGAGVNGGELSIAGGEGLTGAGGGFDIFAGDGATTGGGMFFTGGDGAAGAGGPVSFNPGSGSTDGGDVTIGLPAAGSGRQGLIIVTGMPTADPGVSGALWSNAGVIQISP